MKHEDSSTASQTAIQILNQSIACQFNPTCNMWNSSGVTVVLFFIGHISRNVSKVPAGVVCLKAGQTHLRLHHIASANSFFLRLGMFLWLPVPLLVLLFLYSKRQPGISFLRLCHLFPSCTMFRNRAAPCERQAPARLGIIC